MRAKGYYLWICEGYNLEQVKEKVDLILADFLREMDNLIRIRNAKSSSAIVSIIKEFDIKWVALITLTKKRPECLHGYKLNDDKFIEYLIKQRPEFKKIIEHQIEPAVPYEDIFGPTLTVHTVIPLNEITKENILSELLCCMAAVGEYYQKGLPMHSLTSLCERISFLKYWSSNGINYSEIDEFEDDRKGFIIRKMIIK